MNDDFSNETDLELLHDDWDLHFFERLGMYERTGQVDGDGKPIYRPTDFCIQFIRAHRNDSDEEFDAAIERLRQAH